jgi:hypothetical protein
MALPRWKIAPMVAMVAAASLGGTCPVHGQFPQAPPGHYLHHATMPPGAIGTAQLQRGGPWFCIQGVRITGPAGTLIALPSAGRFEPQAPRVTAGLLVGQVYRLRVTNIPGHEGEEVYPTIEVIDRTFPPPNMAHRFPIPVVMGQDDLDQALAGRFVTRVIYLEDPRNALPVAQEPGKQDWFDARPGEDPLRVADALGRPVAILRIGGRTPDDVSRPSMQFLFNCPAFQRLPND